MSHVFLSPVSRFVRSLSCLHFVVSIPSSVSSTSFSPPLFLVGTCLLQSLCVVFSYTTSCRPRSPPCGDGFRRWEGNTVDACLGPGGGCFEGGVEVKVLPRSNSSLCPLSTRVRSLLLVCGVFLALQRVVCNPVSVVPLTRPRPTPAPSYRTFLRSRGTYCLLVLRVVFPTQS